MTHIQRSRSGSLCKSHAARPDTRRRKAATCRPLCPLHSSPGPSSAPSCVLRYFVHFVVTASPRNKDHHVTLHLQRKLVSREEKPVLGLWWRGCPVAGLLPEGPQGPSSTCGGGQQGPGQRQMAQAAVSLARFMRCGPVPGELRESGPGLGTQQPSWHMDSWSRLAAHRASLPTCREVPEPSPWPARGPPGFLCAVSFSPAQPLGFLQTNSFTCPAPPGRRASAHAFSVGWNSPCHHLFT